MPFLSATVDDSERIQKRIQKHLRSIQLADESWTEAVHRFADEHAKASSTVWRWLNGESRPSRKFLRKLFPDEF